MSRFPEGMRWVRSDGTPDKATRVHKEMEWHKYLREVEHLHTPQTPIRVAYLEFLHEPYYNLIVTEGTKYLGVVRPTTLLNDLLKWGDVPFYKVLSEPLKRIVEEGVKLKLETDDREFREVIKRGQLRIPVLRNVDVIGEVDLFEVFRDVPPKVDVFLKAKQIPSLEKEASIVDALDLLSSSPVILVDNKVLDIAILLRALWKKELRRKKVNEINLRISDLRLENIKPVKSAEEAKDYMITHHKPYAIIKDEGEFKVILLEDFL